MKGSTKMVGITGKVIHITFFIFLAKYSKIKSLIWKLGKFYYPSGVVYEGEFFKGQMHGEGTLICKF